MCSLASFLFICLFKSLTFFFHPATLFLLMGAVLEFFIYSGCKLSSICHLYPIGTRFFNFRLFSFEKQFLKNFAPFSLINFSFCNSCAFSVLHVRNLAHPMVPNCFSYIFLVNSLQPLLVRKSVDHICMVCSSPYFTHWCTLMPVLHRLIIVIFAKSEIPLIFLFILKNIWALWCPLHATKF